MQSWSLILWGGAFFVAGCGRAATGADPIPPDGDAQAADGSSDAIDVGSRAEVDSPASSFSDATADSRSDSMVDRSLDSAGDSPVEATADAGANDGSSSGADAGAQACGTCSAYGSPRAGGPIPAVLSELSGLAASVRHPGLLYAHNDSGDLPRLFALTDTAAVVAELGLDGASAIDWEDVAIGPCPSGVCLFIGDIGDNESRRTGYAIYRVPEPEVLPDAGDRISVSYERLAFVYPDGPHNAETLLVHPGSGRIFVIVKEVEAGVYELPTPLVSDQVATLVKVTTLNLPALSGVVTGGSFHPCGERMLVRTYAALREFVLPPGDPLEAIFGVTGAEVPAATEPQGEAVAYAVDGKGYFMASETVQGSPTPTLNRIGCQ